MKKFKIFSKGACPYCVAAVQLCEEKGISYEKISLDGSPELLLEMSNTYKWKSVPMIVEVAGGGEKFIGGYTDLVEYLGSGKTVLKG